MCHSVRSLILVSNDNVLFFPDEIQTVESEVLSVVCVEGYIGNNLVIVRGCSVPDTALIFMIRDFIYSIPCFRTLSSQGISQVF